MRRTHRTYFRGFEPAFPQSRKKSILLLDLLKMLKTGGESGIRTREAGFSRIHTFQACSFNHSDIAPLEAREPLGGFRGRAL